MKTIIILAALVICLNNKLSAQQHAEVNAKVTESFQKKFNGATNVTWEKTKELEIALFQYEERTWVAYYNRQGELLASARRIREISQLPMAVQASLEDFQNQKSAKGGSFSLGPIFEVVERSGNSYYFIPMENAKQTLSVSIGNDGHAAIHKKQGKMSTMIEENRALLAKKN